METTNAPERQQVHWRIPAATMRDLKAFADRTHRSDNGAAIHLIEAALKAEESAR